MSNGRCSSVCVTDGDRLRDTCLSFRTLDAAGAKRYRGWRTRRRHGACRSKGASSAARHGKRRDGDRRVGRSERSERSRQAAC